MKGKNAYSKFIYTFLQRCKQYILNQLWRCLFQLYLDNILIYTSELRFDGALVCALNEPLKICLSYHNTENVFAS